MFRHPPAAARPGQITQRIENRPKVRCRRAAALRRARKKRLDESPFLVGQIGRITLRMSFKISHPATARSGPHPQRESHPISRFNSFSTDSKKKTRLRTELLVTAVVKLWG